MIDWLIDFLYAVSVSGQRSWAPEPEGPALFQGHARKQGLQTRPVWRCVEIYHTGFNFQPNQNLLLGLFIHEMSGVLLLAPL